MTCRLSMFRIIGVSSSLVRQDLFDLGFQDFLSANWCRRARDGNIPGLYSMLAMFHQTSPAEKVTTFLDFYANHAITSLTRFEVGRQQGVVANRTFFNIVHFPPSNYTAGDMYITLIPDCEELERRKKVVDGTISQTLGHRYLLRMIHGR